MGAIIAAMAVLLLEEDEGDDFDLEPMPTWELVAWWVLGLLIVAAEWWLFIRG